MKYTKEQMRAILYERFDLPKKDGHIAGAAIPRRESDTEKTIVLESGLDEKGPRLKLAIQEQAQSYKRSASRRLHRPYTRTGKIRKLGLGFAAMAAAGLALIFWPSSVIEKNQQKLRAAFVTGNVRVTLASGKKIMLRRGMFLSRSAVITTGDDSSFCHIRTQTGSMIRLEGNSTLKLGRLYLDLKNKLEKTRLDLIRGKILLTIKTLLKGGEFKITTGNTIVGVRGTGLSISFTPSGGTSVAVREGRVYIRRRFAVIAAQYTSKLRNRVKQMLQFCIIVPDFLFENRAPAINGVLVIPAQVFDFEFYTVNF